MCESWWFVGNRLTIGEGHVARIAASELRRLMVVGAKARLIELKSKIAYLAEVFPEPAGPVAIVAASGTHSQSAKPGRKTPISKAERQDASRRMKKYWASRSSSWHSWQRDGLPNIFSSGEKQLCALLSTSESFDRA